MHSTRDPLSQQQQPTNCVKVVNAEFEAHEVTGALQQEAQHQEAQHARQANPNEQVQKVPLLVSKQLEVQLLHALLCYYYYYY